ncbi:alpha/beta hydrolase [Permianibacter sp. IMCC34836]|uniref:alpha/beta hydrolase n=1 Tax=Permianibacter fluminis TaxID=2738515 RepID=UPI0015577685|nr:alpha/beta hydrolase [Permianibacter fluminis]NQD35415.1 alpha/beta hydrolase [Permianibacter fluminis]
MRNAAGVISSVVCLLIASLFNATASAAEPASFDSAFDTVAAFRYLHQPDLVFNTVNHQELLLDVTRPDDNRARPVLLFFHGGGWAYNNKNHADMWLLPWLAEGFAVVNADYRKVDVATAPGAVDDARCALNWIALNADRFHFDLNRIVVSGHSAGGHLALMTGYATDSGLFDRQCWNGDGPKVAAVINWYGITDVADLLSGPHQHAYAVQWIGNPPDPVALAKKVSPLSYLRKDVPPTLSIHGDADTVVPYSHSLRLHEALRKLGVTEQLITVPGANHGEFSNEAVTNAYQAIWAFLARQKLLPDQDRGSGK